eukprot:2509505-Amphidinium_carterae.1
MQASKRWGALTGVRGQFANGRFSGYGKMLWTSQTGVLSYEGQAALTQNGHRSFQKRQTTSFGRRWGTCLWFWVGI